MKNKLILLALSCGLCFAANAQSTEDEMLKPTVGNKTLEVGLNFNGGTNSEIKLRKFNAENMAFRYEASVSYNHDKLSDNATSTGISLSFAPGVEKHFAGTKRLSPYLGFAVPVTKTFHNYKSDEIELKGARSENHFYDRSYFAVGLQGLAGVDFYVVKNFYIGFEVGLGASYHKYDDVEIENKRNFTENRTIEGYNGFNFSSFTGGGLRVGFAF